MKNLLYSWKTSIFQMEFSSGAGGQEAMLFTGELVKMYEKYATFRGWKWEPYELDTVGGGLLLRKYKIH